MELVKVAVNAPLLQPLTYAWDLSAEPQVGLRVHVPLGKGGRKASGVIVGPADSGEISADIEIKNVLDVDESAPALPKFFVDWLLWLSDYYLHPVGQVLQLAYPPLKKFTDRKSKKSPVLPEVQSTQPPKLTEEQSHTLQSLGDLQGFSVHLLHGVTGSGKTEVYLRSIEKVLCSGKQALVLVPEIALTPQLVQRFVSRFGDEVAVIHSHLTDRERTQQWWAGFHAQKRILIGARSALFCPLKDLALIVVDEEHEASYKQDEKLKYNARDAAVMLGKQMNIPVLLGSATPSLESWQNALDQRYRLHQMKNRVENRSMPKVEVIDLRSEQLLRKGQDSHLPFWLSETLFEKMSQRLEAGEQVALFLNRRGMAQTTVCPGCGFTHKCPNCEISLTLHGKRNLVCHYCDYAHLLEEICPHCKESELKSLGLGTEQIEEELKKRFPDAKVRRADRDEITTREDMEDLVRDMENHEIDILVGTQMIAKGLDFPKLNLVGLILADIGFNLPDFRSVERSFQLLTQMSGRSGRHLAEGGEVIVQTYNPLYPALPFAQTADFEGFAEQELQMREELKYPPFHRLAGFRLSGTKLNMVEDLGDLIAHRASKLKLTSAHYQDVTLLGPADAPLAKVRNRYRKNFLIKAPHQQVLSAFCKQLLGDGKWIPNGTKVQVDIDPYHLM